MAETNKPENPPAFACAATAGLTQTGMTLRDYFAAKAMQGELSSGCQNVENDEDLVKYSYSIADLMLLERSK